MGYCMEVGYMTRAVSGYYKNIIERLRQHIMKDILCFRSYYKVKIVFINRYITLIRAYSLACINTCSKVIVKEKYLKGISTPLKISLLCLVTKIVPQYKSLCKAAMIFITSEHGTIITPIEK